MTKEKAIDIVIKDYPDTQIRRIVEYKYENLFVFILGAQGEHRVSNTVAVDKQSGNLIAFNLLEHHPDEYMKAIKKGD